MSKLQGSDVILYEKAKVGTDPVGNPIWSETPVIVPNVLITPSSDTEITDSLNLHGKKAVYTLSVPKGDIHNWEDSKVDLFGERFQTIGKGLQFIDKLVPLDWNLKVIAGYIDNGDPIQDRA
jgi:hypothetical protein